MPYTGAQPDDEDSSATVAPDAAPDLRPRYPVAASGMPSNLAVVASGNLASQDAAMGNVNAVSRMNASPGVGAPGSTSSSDASNLSVAAAMDRADLANRTVPSVADLHTDDIAARRDQIDSRQKVLMATLGMISPAAAGLAAVVTPGHDKYGLAKRQEMLQELHSLEGQSKDLLQEHQFVTTAQAKDANENLARQLHIRVSSGNAKIFNGLADISQQYPVDSPQHRLAALHLFGSDDPDIAAARATPQFESLVRPYVDLHDKSVATAARIKEAANQGADQYFSVEALHEDHPNAEYRQDPKTGGYYVALAKQADSAKIPQAAFTDLGRLNAKKASDSVFLAKEVDPGRKADMQKKVDATQAAIDAWHETYSPQTTAATPAAIQPAGAPAATPASPAAATPPPNITPEVHAALKSGDKFWWNGQQLTKK